MDFMDTQLGVALCYTAQEALGKYLREKQQYCKTYGPAAMIEEVINDELKPGVSVVSIHKDVPDTGWYLVVYEK